MTDSVQPAQVLAFWFGQPGDADWGQSRAAWFVKSDAFDDQIRQRFGATVERALAGGCEDWGSDGSGLLAYLLLLDQFTRNMFRNTPRAFAGDRLALAAARRMVEQGWDQAVPAAHRSFCYLPFEHSESLADQQESLRLFDALQKEPGVGEVYRWALDHYKIVERFGRFPHRNEILGRASTAEEIEFLKQPGSRF